MAIRGPYSEHNGTWVNGDWTSRPAMIVGGWLSPAGLSYAVIFDEKKAREFLAGDESIEPDIVVPADWCFEFHSREYERRERKSFVQHVPGKMPVGN